MLNDILLGVITLNVIIVSVIMLKVIVLSHGAWPDSQTTLHQMTKGLITYIIMQVLHPLVNKDAIKW